VKYDASVAIIGAGPYGLSVAAHLKARGIPVLVFGKPMEFWQNMPGGLCLKSVWSASSLSDPAGAYNLKHFLAATGLSRQEPIPLDFFLAYARWFQHQTVPDVDPTYVQSLARKGRYFQLELADGRTVVASRVIVAVGISPFTNIPDFARDLPAELASHTQNCADLARYKERHVVVVGGGQSALEYAALLHEAGADVELIARGPVLWHNHTLYAHTGPARHIFYPPGDVGPPGINWLVAFPKIFRHFPDKVKYPVHRRSVRPGGAKWLRPRIEGRIQLTTGTHIVRATEQGRSLCIELSDGAMREADFLFLGTGYRPDIHRLTFIDSTLSRQVQEVDGYPVLSRWFESSVPHLYFAGALAGHTFGPTCRFVSGTKAPAGQIARHVAQAK
jgi:thioredoxin reductase